MDGVQGLSELADSLGLLDRAGRIEVLSDYARQFEQVPESLVAQPYPEASRVPGCDSEVFAFAFPHPTGLDFRFGILNRQGVSAMALAAMLQEHLTGAPIEAVLTVPDDIVYRLFGRELSMGKSMGLMNMVGMVKALAQCAVQNHGPGADMARQ